MVTAKEIRQRAAQLVRQGWCQGRYAVNAHNRGVSAHSKHAVRWCALGALLKACGDDTALYWWVIGEFDSAGINVVAFNDVPDRTAEEVARLLETGGRNHGKS